MMSATPSGTPKGSASPKASSTSALDMLKAKQASSSAR
jgi:hypothetical protein